MQKLLAIGFTDLRLFLSDRANLVGLLLIPSVLTIVLGFLGGDGGGSPTIWIAVVDDDVSTQSEQFIEDISEIGQNFETVQIEDTEDEARQRLVNGDFAVLVVIPEGFGSAVENFEGITLRFYSNEDLTSPGAIQPTIQAIVGRWNGSIVAARVGESVAESVGATVETQDIYDSANAILAQNPVQFDLSLTAVEDDGSSNGFNQSVPGMGTMFVLFTILGGMAVLIRERQQWTIQRLIVMPVSRAQIIGGKIFAYFVLGMIQYAVVFAIGFFFGMDFGNNFIAVLLVAMAFSLAGTSLTFALATMLRTEGQAGQLTTLLGLSLAALGGAWWPLEIVPEFMQIVGHFSPIAWAMDGFQDIIWYNRGIGAVLPEIGVLLAISAVLFVVGIVNFKYE